MPSHSSSKRAREPENLAYESEDSGPEENAVAFRIPLSPTSQTKKKSKKRRKVTSVNTDKRTERNKRLTVEERLNICFSAILDDAGLTFPDFLKYTFQFEDQDGNRAHPLLRQAQCVQQFLNGEKSEFTVAKLVETLYRHPYGRRKDSRLGTKNEGTVPFCTTTDWRDIRPVRDALRAFAAQTVLAELGREAEEAVKPENGLHTVVPKRKAQATADSVPNSGSESGATHRSKDWADIGSATAAHVEAIVRKHQPLTWDCALTIAERGYSSYDRRPNSESSSSTRSDSERKYRPSHLVALHAITSLDFSRTNRANLFPTATGLLHFAMSAPVDIIHYGARLGFMPAYNTLYKYLENFAAHEAEAVKEHARSNTSSRVFYTDNVQNYLLRRDVHFGRQNELIAGLAATYVEGVDCDVSAFDLEEKRRLLLENKRADLTVQQLFDFIDQKHREIVGALQWLRTLVENIPELGMYKSKVSELYRTRGAKQQVPVTKSAVHPLGCTSNKETVTSELLAAILDFLAQLGQTRDDFLARLILVGGDGLTYEKLIQLKNIMAIHRGSAFENLDIIEPVLAMWHTAWTELSRLFACHWGTSLSRDESTLGHSATKMGRKTPPNLSKVDYKEGVETLFAVLDARILDCFRVHYDTPDVFEYFKERSRSKNLPTFEELESTALSLYRAYATTRGYEFAMHAQSNRNRKFAASTTTEPLSPWEKTVPIGTPWTPLGSTTDSDDTGNQFDGDRVLAQSIVFMRDSVVLREFILATCEGDVGRVYEALKVMVFTFAGSTHTKYTSYLLEMISSLELESTPQLRHAVLSCLVVNLTGKPGSFQPGDLMQEYFNRLLEAVAQKKGVEYGEHFVRNVVSRNLHHFACLLNDLKDGVGLQHRSGRHSAPDMNVEGKILAGIYRDAQLHSRRQGREYPGDLRNVDEFGSGYEKLRGGKLKKWVAESMFLRSIRVPVGTSTEDATAVAGSGDAGDLAAEGSDDEGSDIDDADKASEADGEDRPMLRTVAFASLVDGELILEDVDFDAAACTLLANCDEHELNTDDRTE